MYDIMFNVNEEQDPKEYTVTSEDIDDIMCTALEGGVNYWCDCCEVVDEYLGEYASEQISRGGELRLHDCECDEWYTINIDMLINGIKLAIEDKYAAEWEWYYSNSECDDNGQLDCCQIDGEVADAIIQYALFDEVIYG